MKGLTFICLGALIATACLSFFILFEGKVQNLSIWWQNIARNSESLPFCPYKNRTISKAEIRTEDANEVVIEDQHLFWKGSGAILRPAIDKDGNVETFKVLNGGSGYSSMIRVFVSGANGDSFIFKDPIIHNGKIKQIRLKNPAKWHDHPLVYANNEKFPYSGIVESKYSSGQIIEQVPYLSGKIHGTKRRWNEYGIPLSALDYVHGKKHGTHIYWFEKTNDPEDFVPVKSRNGEIYPTLWIKLREEAKKKFKHEFGSHPANEWVTFNYRSNGGEFPVRLLEHWHENLRHGLFEGFDQFGNKTFKDDYQMGLRIKHKTFDKTKG